MPEAATQETPRLGASSTCKVAEPRPPYRGPRAQRIWPIGRPSQARSLRAGVGRGPLMAGVTIWAARRTAGHPPRRARCRHRSRRFTRRRRFGKAGHDYFAHQGGQCGPPWPSGRASRIAASRAGGCSGDRWSPEAFGGQPRRVAFPASAISATRHRRPSACPHQRPSRPPAPPARQAAEGRPSMSCFKISNVTCSSANQRLIVCAVRSAS